MGHMLGDTVRDIYARWHRMRGEATLWFPGLDHAGLSTQVEVRRRLSKQGVVLDDLPREEVLRHVQSWKQEHEARILEQDRAGGFSFDWSRYRYTFDDGAVRATRRAFVELYRDGLIYQGERIVNWDPKLRTAISDLEVLHAEEPAEMLYLRYAWADGAAGGLEVATVRPETIFGDVAVAVHPDDARHRSDVGRTVRVPLTDRIVPVIADPGVDPAFGTGALKVTPRHDLLDHEIGLRHPELAKPEELFSPDGHLSGGWVPAEYQGLDREKGRAATRAALEAAGLLLRVEKVVHSVGRSERTDAVVEPRLSKQWFVRMPALAPPVVAAVRDGTIQIHPERWRLTFDRWMEGLQDWCISRQVVWGHRVPVQTCRTCGMAICELEPAAACPKCGGKELTDDPDVLDTWFTSWMWPFLGLGWPEPTEDLAHYYPTSLLVTGRDIMFFWVARMMMAGYRFQGKPPFRDVYFTGMLRDQQGRRMSKHLGNSPDPLAIIRARGADTMRFALVFPNPVDQDGPFGEATLDGARNLLTKLWNLGRFATISLPEGADPARRAPTLGPDSALADRWILSRWSATQSELDEALGSFEPSRAATILYNFLWHDLADVYVEAAKESLAGRRGEPAARETRATLLFVIERLLRDLHPIVPHVTEELWHALPHEGEALAIAAWPTPGEAIRDADAEVQMGAVQEAVRALRNLRSEGRVLLSATPAAWYRPSDPPTGALLGREAALIARLAKLSGFAAIGADGAIAPNVGRSVTPVGELFLELPEEASRAGAQEKERAMLQELLQKTQTRLADPTFRAKAPPKVVAEAEAKAAELVERLRKFGGPVTSEGSP